MAKAEKTNIERLREMLGEAGAPPAETVEAELSRPVTGGEDIDAIINRLREHEAPRPSVADTRAIELREAVLEGAQGAREVDFSRVSGELARGVSFLGRLYQAFEAPLSKLATALAELPLARPLQDDLAAANMSYSAEAWVALVTTASLVFLLVVSVSLASLGAILTDPALAATAPLLGIAGFLIFAFFGLRWPALRASGRAAALDRELPFALRQISTQVKAGVSFNRAMVSIASGAYPLLSVEFRRVLVDLERGASTEEALTSLVRRNRSRGLRRAISQILRALRTGGRVSDVIANIADDVAFETRMRIRDFTETLNLVSIVYIMVAVVAPVALTILSAVVQLPLLAGFIPPEYIMAAFGGILMSMGLMLFVTIRLEPGT